MPQGRSNTVVLTRLVARGRFIETAYTKPLQSRPRVHPTDRRNEL